MGRPKGLPKTGGRQKGTPNKNRSILIEMCEKRGIDPFARLLDFCNDPDPELAFAAVKEACQYVHAKRRAVEHSEDENAPVGEKAANKALEKLKELHDQAMKERKRG